MATPNKSILDLIGLEPIWEKLYLESLNTPFLKPLKPTRTLEPLKPLLEIEWEDEQRYKLLDRTYWGFGDERKVRVPLEFFH